ncbi:heme exporter protein CcmD [Vibrio algivorus]|uniref:Heme exporter protein D n=1 Tax=Vibrio algivorus TaxID=1667024 RepID=A0A557PAZ8_9VIBR|nr:heme exporter protein CcmD [Vibrio algivorus]TVO37823.1 heme exporter protein CcmD [Vibrio algivorus]GLT16211.1 heme exporter protein D [Vibrio algivorus]
MYFDSFSDFLNMGGYAAYVWASFGITFFSMLVVYWKSVSDGKALLKEIQQKIDREERRQAAKKMENTL